ncbi:MAG: CDP-alcohol phosphatidyltransferase family protein [Candidatus Hydrogenedentes bacterium]|nr:CDP-alcohol phosphatidyltransferase family protein [Candidatus Hydrogenedentota bacterium]
MDNYAPKSRRPIAEAFRRTANSAVNICVRWGIHPDTVSYLSIVFAALAGLCFLRASSYPILLLVAPLFCYIRLWLNMLDGMVALASGKASPHGEIVNEVPDRVSDILIFAGIAHSGLCFLPLGYWAALLAVFTAYVGIFGQAVGVQREFSGIMAKPWRMVVAHLGAWLALSEHWSGADWCLPLGLTMMDCALVVVIGGCAQTIYIRLSRIVHSLNRQSAEPDGE